MIAVVTNKISTVTGRFNDFIRPTFAIGEFSDGAGRSITVDLNFGHHKIADCENDR